MAKQTLVGTIRGSCRVWLSRVIICIALFDCAVSYLPLQLEFVKTSFHVKNIVYACLCISMPSMEFQTSTLHQA